MTSGCFGFALAAFPLRFAWIWPLILLPAFAGFTTIHSSAGHSDLVVGLTLVAFVGFGVVLLRMQGFAVESRPARASSR